MTEPDTATSPAWREVGDRVWTATVEPDTVNLGLIAGTTGCLLVDSGSTPAQGAGVRESVAVAGVPLVGLVLTHGHHDHVGGLSAFADLPTIGHAELPGPFSRPIALAAAIDLGDRRVEIVHLGEGHTASDLVVAVADADLVFAGDLVESATPPWFGPDSTPGQWPATLDGLIGLLGEDSVVVPGHGPPMDREAVFLQRSELAAVAGELRQLVQTGVPLAQAASRGRWPYPVEHIEPGLAAGYAELGAVDLSVGNDLKGGDPNAGGGLSGRRLPLV